MSIHPGNCLLQTEAFVHQALQSRLVEDVIGKFFVGKHGESRPLGTRSELRRFFYGEVFILTDHRHHHAHHQLQATNIFGLLVGVTQVGARFSHN